MIVRKGFLLTSLAIALFALATNLVAAPVVLTTTVTQPTTVTQTTTAPQRIASLNLCTDQMLLMLVPRTRIFTTAAPVENPQQTCR